MPQLQSTTDSPAINLTTSRISCTIIGRCDPAGVFALARIFNQSAEARVARAGEVQLRCVLFPIPNPLLLPVLISQLAIQYVLTHARVESGRRGNDGIRPAAVAALYRPGNGELSATEGTRFQELVIHWS